jgi:hypothetical protein
MSEVLKLGPLLIQFLAENPSGAPSFPLPTVDYYIRYTAIADYLNANVHPLVNQGATANSGRRGPKKPAVPVWLTDHGPEHIATVIRRASDLVCSPDCQLSPYEAYLLLLAIHFHDVGNLYGREEHERRITDVMQQIPPILIGEDTFEQRLIRDIAMVHGGTVPGTSNKDTISGLKYTRNAGANQPRVRLLAAVLRFADELADDHTRTSRFLLNGELVAPNSEVYHLYADRLQSVAVDMAHHLVDLNFEINQSVAAKKLRKLRGRTYLFDEILARTLKMHSEHVYCSRFMRPTIHIEQIRVQVKICTDDYMTELESISYSMMESGYPNTSGSLATICPELRGLTGAALAKRLATMKRGR